MTSEREKGTSSNYNLGLMDKGHTFNQHEVVKTRENVIQIMHTSFQHSFPIPEGASEPCVVHRESYGQ